MIEWQPKHFAHRVGPAALKDHTVCIDDQPQPPLRRAEGQSVPPRILADPLFANTGDRSVPESLHHLARRQFQPGRNIFRSDLNGAIFELDHPYTRSNVSLTCVTQIAPMNTHCKYLFGVSNSLAVHSFTMTQPNERSAFPSNVPQSAGQSCGLIDRIVHAGELWATMRR